MKKVTEKLSLQKEEIGASMPSAVAFVACTP